MRPRTKTKEPSDASKAVVELRTALKQTQQEFAQTLDTAITTIARYETDRSPRSNALVKLFAVAHYHKLDDLKKRFIKALAADIGVQEGSFHFGIGIEDDPLTVRVNNAQELADCSALLRTHRNREFIHIGRKITRLLKPVKKFMVEESELLAALRNFADRPDFTPEQTEQARSQIRKMSDSTLMFFWEELLRPSTTDEPAKLSANLRTYCDEIREESSRREAVARAKPAEKPYPFKKGHP